MVSTWPPGSVIRLVSSAPSTEVYQAAAASGFRVTRWQVSELISRTIHTVQTVCIDSGLGMLPPWLRPPDRTGAGPPPIGLHPTTVTAINGTRVGVAHLEAVDGTPVLDIKPLLGPPPGR